MDFEAAPPRLDSRPVDLEISRAPSGVRLDSYLASAFPGHSRSLLQKVIEAGAVTVNGGPAKASQKVRDGDHVRLWLPASTAAAPAAEDIPLEIVYEDEVLAVVNKPPNMVVHP